MNKLNPKEMTPDQITHSLLVTNGHLLAIIAECLLNNMNTTLDPKETQALIKAVQSQQDVLNALLRKSIPEDDNGKA